MGRWYEACTTFTIRNPFFRQQGGSTIFLEQGDIGTWMSRYRYPAGSESQVMLKLLHHTGYFQQKPPYRSWHFIGLPLSCKSQRSLLLGGDKNHARRWQERVRLGPTNALRWKGKHAKLSRAWQEHQMTRQGDITWRVEECVHVQLQNSMCSVADRKHCW